MVLDMLRLSVDSKFRFTRKKSGIYREPRWRGDRLFGLIANPNDVIREEMSFYDIQYNENGFMGDNRKSGMRVLCIDLGEAQE